MITSWDIYWITRLDGINAIMAILCIVSVVAVLVGVVIWIFGTIEEDDAPIKYGKLTLKAIIPLLIFSSFGVVFTPSTKEFAAIYLIPKIANNEQVQKVPENLVKLLNSKMEEWIESSLKDKKK